VSDDLTQLTVNLTESAATALEFAAVLSGDNRTDTVNRALLIFNAIAEVATEGGGRLSFELIDGGERVRVDVNRPWWRFW
jgi:hypothetical protein